MNQTKVGSLIGLSIRQMTRLSFQVSQRLSLIKDRNERRVCRSEELTIVPGAPNPADDENMLKSSGRCHQKSPTKNTTANAAHGDFLFQGVGNKNSLVKVIHTILKSYDTRR